LSTFPFIQQPPTLLHLVSAWAASYSAPSSIYNGTLTVVVQPISHCGRAKYILLSTTLVNPSQYHFQLLVMLLQATILSDLVYFYYKNSILF
jgi:hypothetical protein